MKPIELDQTCRECGKCAGQLQGHWYAENCPEDEKYVGRFD